VVAEFTLETDVKYAEQQIRDRTSGAKRKLPTEIEEPVIRRIDPADQPILIVSLAADLDAGKLYELADPPSSRRSSSSRRSAWWKSSAAASARSASTSIAPS